MTKTTSAAMDAHLALEVTSLATCWRISRTDGVEFFFTDHDVDIIFEGNTYLAETGYKRTAVQNDSSMAVDNLDIEGVFDSEQITEIDLRAGLFDHAQIRVFIINWDDLTDGDIKMRNGRLGEVTLTEQGIFRAELRGLTQALSQRVGEVYQPECRADLGDSRCKVPIQPDLRADSTAYFLGDFIRVATTTVFQPVVIPITNAGFDTGDLTGWTTASGTPTVITDDATLFPQAGTHFLQGTNSEDYEVRQDVDISGIINTTSIDNGDVTVSAQVYQADTFAGDLGAFTVEALTSADVFISTLFDSGFAERGDASTWTTVGVTMTDVVLPVNCRKIRYRLRGDFTAGTIVNAEFDSLSSTFTDSAGAPVDTQGQYENRIYECTTAGTSAAAPPTYDTTVNNTTADGTAVFTAREAWTRSAVLETIVDRKTFTLADATYDESRDVDGWFDGGALIFESGDNLGKVIEIRDWLQANRQVTIFLPTGFDVTVGTLVRLYPGCDKRDSTCITKFVMPQTLNFANGNIKNFRGEPFVPGTDVLASYPDAK